MAKQKTATETPTTADDRIKAVLDQVDVAKADCDQIYRKHFPEEVTLHAFRNAWSRKVADTQKQDS